MIVFYLLILLKQLHQLLLEPPPQVPQQQVPQQQVLLRLVQQRQPPQQLAHQQAARRPLPLPLLQRQHASSNLFKQPLRLHQQQQRRTAFQQHQLRRRTVLVSYHWLNICIYKVSCTILGTSLHWDQTGTVVAGTTQGTAADELKNPTCLYIDQDNTLYICDYDNNRIQMWILCATSGITVAGSSTGAAGSTSILLNSPEDVTFDKNGFMYVADHENHRVQRFTPNSTVGTTVAGTGSKTSALTDLDHLTAIDVDNNSNIYVLDIHNKRVIQWAPNATSGTVLINDNDINGASDILLAPGSTDQAYISDTDGNQIYLWTFNASTPAVTLSSVSTGSSTLNKPAGMVFDPYGNLYVADTDNNRVVMYCANSTVGIVVATGTTPAITKPMAVAFDSDLNLYVASSGTDQVIRFLRQ